MSGSVSGTRYTSSLSQSAGVISRDYDASLSTDPGVSPQAHGAFAIGGGFVTLAGAFGAFVPGTFVLIENTVANNGEFLVLSATANTLTLSPMPVSEIAPSIATIRPVINVYDGLAPVTPDSGVPFTFTNGTFDFADGTVLSGAS